MSAPQIDPQLAMEVAVRKQGAVRWSARANRTLGALFLASILVGLTVWFGQQPMNRDEILLSGVLGLGLATFFVGGLLFRMLDPKPSATCPQCGCDWNAESRNDLHQWLTWQHCPGCGLYMSGDESTQPKP